MNHINTIGGNSLSHSVIWADDKRRKASLTGLRCRTMHVFVCFWFMLFCAGDSSGTTYEIYPATVDSREEFETIANSLKPGDELILHGGLYSQSARRAVTAKGTAAKPIVIRAAEGEKPLLIRRGGLIT